MDDGRSIAVTGVPGYRVEALIGRGGMGEVYRAVDERLGRPVALKVLTDSLAADERYRARLLEESRRAASLDHPNVIPVYEAGEADGLLFLAMRYVTGTDLRALLRREGALEPERAIAIAAQVADALDAAHRRDLVHRDVKRSHILRGHADGREHASRPTAGSQGPSTTSLPSRSAATPSTAAPTSTASRACCSSA